MLEACFVFPFLHILVLSDNQIMLYFLMNIEAAISLMFLNTHSRIAYAWISLCYFLHFLIHET